MKSSNLKVYRPSSTYRVQFHKDFTLKDLEAHLDYLDELGITTIYASPLFKATPGSMHGYDVTDPHVINPEIGTLDDLKRISARLKEKNMRWIQDIVPNHMAFNEHNDRLMDVLQRGQYSEFYTYFDVDWNHPSPELSGKIMVPFLGDDLENCIDNREVQLVFGEDGLRIKYYDNTYPISIPALGFILNEAGELTSESRFHMLQDRVQEIQSPISKQEWEKYRTQWINELQKDKMKRGLVDDLLAVINQDTTKLRYILDQQCYALTHWKRTEKEIDYRRFFTINSLICLCQEDESVFDDYHTFLVDLYKQDIIHGLRIDHIDGLNDPNLYLEKLRKLFGDECYIVAEKILEAHEDMPEHWPLQGESGYQFLALTNQLLTNMQGGSELLQFYKKFIPEAADDYHELVLKNKQYILENYMAGEWDNLTRYFFDLGLGEGYTQQGVKKALAAFMLCLPVYRIYPQTLPATGAFAEVLQQTFKKAYTLFGETKKELDYLKQLLEQPGDSDSKVMSFLNRMMQFTGPLTAKGVEDTTFYVYNAMISHCEVGDSPAELGIASVDFHDRMIRRMEDAPLSMNATATHDTKRGEDARIRLNVISEMPAEWEEKVRQWMEINKPLRRSVDGTAFPTANDEYFIYQAVVGGFPENLQADETFISRLQEYMVKVVREAKVNSNWETPNEAYENACKEFIAGILDSKHKFLRTFIPFQQKVLQYAQVYSLTQVMLKVTAPGIPDIYQGCELWDLSFVDPDNRRPVDYEKRKNLLAMVLEKEKEGFEKLKKVLDEKRAEGVEKLYVTRKALDFRKAHADLFSLGSYVPLLTTRKGVVLSFIRHYEGATVMVAVPIGLTILKPTKSKPIETEIIIPEAYRGKWRSVFTESLLTLEDRLHVEEVFDEFAVAMLMKED